MALSGGAIGRPRVPQTIMEGFSLEVAPSGPLRSNGFEMAGFSFFLPLPFFFFLKNA